MEVTANLSTWISSISHTRPQGKLFCLRTILLRDRGREKISLYTQFYFCAVKRKNLLSSLYYHVTQQEALHHRNAVKLKKKKTYTNISKPRQRKHLFKMCSRDLHCSCEILTADSITGGRPGETQWTAGPLGEMGSDVGCGMGACCGG
jgi:hypothetical protein